MKEQGNNVQWDNFLWGVSTSSYQIEGAVAEDGRTPCIWDLHCGIPGNILNGDTGETACDHYHRYQEDVALMKELGVNSYRFSIAWSRIYPQRGVYNEKGMQFYKNLIRELKANKILPCVTIYHWDLPQWVQEAGGWDARETVDLYLEYADTLFRELDADVNMWITHNEPYCSGFLGNHMGEHAPGIKSLEKAIRSTHHILLSHGQAVRLYHEKYGTHPIGITLNLGVMYPQTDTVRDQLAQKMADGYTNRWFLDALFRKQYPADMLALFAARCATDFDFIQQGDSECIGEPMDFLGINHYSSTTVSYVSAAPNLYAPAVTEKKKNAIGWDLDPDAFYELLVRLRKEYTDIPVFITENGFASEDASAEEAVHDPDRISYLEQYLHTVEKMKEQGLGIYGYFVWSLMDNFEWPSGYAVRFGLVAIDYRTLERRKKDSFLYYQEYLADRMG